MNQSRVIILGNFTSAWPHVVYEKMAARLAQSDIGFSVEHEWRDDYASADLIVAAQPIADSEALLDCRILGQRTLNRKTRLDVASRFGTPVVPYGSPRNDQELDQLAAAWRSDCAVLKYDWSSRRKGVFLWPLGSEGRKPFPQDFNPEADVFMEFQESDPRTYKVDAFGGILLATYIIETRDMRSPAWQAVTEPVHLPFDLPDEAARHVAEVSTALLSYGAGYSSFDLMRDGDDFRIIEMNTCGVGASMWNMWPDQYADAYSRAIVETLRQIDRVPRYRDLRGLALSCGNDAEAIRLPRHTTQAGARPTEPASGAPKLSAEARFMQLLNRTEKVSAQEMRACVLEPLARLLHHAREQVPFYSGRLDMLFASDGSIDFGAWQHVPILRRADLAGRQSDLIARTLPYVDGSVSYSMTSGTESAPITVARSRPAQVAASCISMRFFSWHGVSPTATLVSILTPRARTAATGKTWIELSSEASVTAQLKSLKDAGPVWLHTRPSLAQQMALTVKEHPQLRPKLLGLLTSGEILTEDQRRLCQYFLGHDPRDIYELKEVGAVALQCPKSRVYHVQMEAVLVEVLDEEGRGCSKGATGRLVVTPLYNLAMPLIRYDTGDFVVAGDRFDGYSGRLCICGRRLPRLQSVLGRPRNQFVFSGKRRPRPAIDSSHLHDLTGAKLWQLVQDDHGQFILHLDSDPSKSSSSGAVEAARYVSEALGGNCEVKTEWTNLSRSAAERRFEPFLRQGG